MMLDWANDRMWLIYFVTAFNWSVTGNLAPYILSDFEAHSLVTVIGIVSGVLGAALYMPIAKMLNLFDRSYGFLFLVFLSIVGLITSAVCKNVQTYAAAQVSLYAQNGTRAYDRYSQQSDLPV